MTKPKSFGGLGIRMTRNQNTTLLGKRVWDLIHLANQLWVSILTSKYLREGNLFMAKGRKGSISWNSISKVLEVLEDGFRIKLGDGNMWFWFDAWVVKELLAKRVSWVDIHDIHLKVKEVWVSPEWTFEECLCLALSKPGGINEGRLELDLEIEDNDKWLILPLVGFFIFVLKHRGIGVQEGFPRCETMPKALEHCLFSCIHSWALWLACGVNVARVPSSDVELLTWLRELIHTHGLLMPITMLTIWLAGNKLNFLALGF
ncbi:hypothetical protein GYH30_012090 [Glycine max]|nr:hypothetical protein GYH30_012090 [Glycine max]